MALFSAGAGYNAGEIACPRAHFSARVDLKIPLYCGSGETALPDPVKALTKMCRVSDLGVSIESGSSTASYRRVLPYSLLHVTETGCVVLCGVVLVKLVWSVREVGQSAPSFTFLVIFCVVLDFSFFSRGVCVEFVLKRHLFLAREWGCITNCESSLCILPCTELVPSEGNTPEWAIFS